MRSFSIFLSILFVGVVFYIGCSDSSTSPSDTGTLTIRLTDAPANLDAVNITFSEISARIDSQWVTVEGEPQTVNLLEWNNGKSIVIGTEEVPAGTYTQIRLKIEDANVVVDGVTHPMMVPSGAQSGLKLLSNFTIPAGSSFELILDFDACRSVVTTGPPNAPNGYKLKPTIRVIPDAITGSISGTVTNPEHLPTAYALAGTDTVTTSMVNGNTGEFMLAFLPVGTYTVSISDTLNNALEMTGVGVTVGSDTDIGEVTLE